MVKYQTSRSDVFNLVILTILMQHPRKPKLSNHCGSKPPISELHSFLKALKIQTLSLDEFKHPIWKVHFANFAIFPAQDPRKFRARTSSANWSGVDRLLPTEELYYKEKMGFGEKEKQRN